MLSHDPLKGISPASQEGKKRWPVFPALFWKQLFLVVPALVFAGWMSWVEIMQWKAIREDVVRLAPEVGKNYAGTLSNRLDAAFGDLQFAAQELMGRHANLSHPGPAVVQRLERFMALHPGFYAFNIQSADGRSILWSTRAWKAVPITPAARFTRLAGYRNRFLGQDTYSRRAGAPVLTMRYRLRDAAGHILGFVGSPYRLDTLMKTRISYLLPWTFIVRDTRDGGVLGSLANGKPTFGSLAVAGLTRGGSFPVLGYPLVVETAWPRNLVWKLYVARASLRWTVEGISAVFVVLSSLLFSVRMRKQERLAFLNARLADFTMLLSRANETIARTSSEQELLQAVCDLAIQFGHVSLAWIGRPDTAGWFAIGAASGKTTYLEHLRVSSMSAFPEDGGPASHVWRTQKPLYCSSWAQSGFMEPWKNSGEISILEASAALPIFRGGQVWAVLTVYDRESTFSDPALQHVLESLSQDIGYGLDRLDSSAREREASALNELLLENMAAGTNVIRYPEMVIERINAQALEMFGASSIAQVVGRHASEFYADAGTFQKMGELSGKVLQAGWGMLRDVPYRRLDGQTIYVDVSGKRLQGSGPAQRIVWTYVDVTERYRRTEELQQQALKDPLTGLPNRRAMENVLENAMKRARRHERLLAVVMMDLDGFKPVNDLYGHGEGDHVLQTIGTRLMSGLRSTDFVARLGGDEFVLAVEDCFTVEEVEDVLAKAGELVREPIVLNSGVQVSVQVSAGVCLYPLNPCEHPGDLLRLADRALYSSKEHKADRTVFWVFYEESVLGEKGRLQRVSEGRYF